MTRIVRAAAILLAQALPAILIVTFWELATRNDSVATFYFGRPSAIAQIIQAGLRDGSLGADFATTASEAGLGFLIGTFGGALLGLALWFSRTAFVISRPYVIALGATPAFALAPLFIIWFGTGYGSKVAIATFSTFIVATVQAYSGVDSADRRYVRAAQALGASRQQIFRKIIVPSALAWIFGAAQLNVGLALLGAFIGEVISSQAGLGHAIMVASGLFDISRVWAGILSFIVLAILATLTLDQVQGRVLRILVRYL
jgi:NitT/TauT family transport system permease protein